MKCTMRHVWMLLVSIAFVATGCNNNTYSNLRNQEDKLIANYISRNGLHILREEPEDDYVWDEKDYYKVVGYDNFYYHLISRGDSVRIDTVSESRIDTVDLAIQAVCLDGECRYDELLDHLGSGFSVRVPLWQYERVRVGSMAYCR